jgi:hypothetical protein
MSFVEKATNQIHQMKQTNISKTEQTKIPLQHYTNVAKT